MNLLDLLLVLAMAAAAYGGYRLGFVARALSWAGLAVGVTIAVLFVDDLVNALRAEPARSRLFAALSFVFVLATLGQAAGFAAGTALRSRITDPPALRTGDRVGGAATGALGAGAPFLLAALGLGLASVVFLPWLSNERLERACAAAQAAPVVIPSPRAAG